jgi:hypothetical protein
VLASAANNAITAISLMEVKEGNEHAYQFVRDQVLTISDTDSLGLGGDVATPEAGSAHWDLVESETTDTPDLFQVTINITLSGNGDVAPDNSTETMMLLRPQWSDTEVRSTDLSDIEANLQNVRTQQPWP